MSRKLWNYKNKDLTKQEIAEISKTNHIPPLMALLLKNRGITEPEKIKKYIRKTLDNIHDPMGLPDMDKATERIVSAIRNKEKIVVYGDYDVDGVTSTALLVSFLRKRGAQVSYYIPSRETEGYGINVMAVNKISKEGTKLMITVDCGITAIGEIELAKTMGMDVIVTDHHLCKEKLPKAVAVIDPKRADSEYPFDALAGVGVAFKLALSVAKALGEKTSDCFFEFVELAAIGTVADVVSLLDENRVIAEKGISALKNTQNIGVKALLSVSEANKRPVTTTTISFMLAPRINAGGRLGSADVAVELLLSDNEEKAVSLARELEEANSDRRLREQKIYEEAEKMVLEDERLSEKKVIVLAQKDWHHGVIGIAASRITEKFGRPSILISYDDKGVGKGSGRSVEGFHLFEALDAVKDHLTNFGGHSMAAGVGINKDDIEAFSLAINEYAKERMAETVSKIDIDCELSASMITLENAKMLEYMEPFGEDNPRPVFTVTNGIIKKLDNIGNDGSHIRMTIEKDGKMLNAVGFRMRDAAREKHAGDYISIAFTLEINSFGGEDRVQLILKDIK